MSGLVAERIVVPLDFSDLSFDALDRALEIAGPESRVEVVHVLAQLPAMEYGNLYGTVTEETRIQNAKESLRERLTERQCEHIGIHVFVGDAGREIAEFASRQDADLIVIPSHGYGFYKHLLLGSVAERVIRLSHCPVLVLRS